MIDETTKEIGSKKGKTIEWRFAMKTFLWERIQMTANQVQRVLRCKTQSSQVTALGQDVPEFGMIILQ